VVCRVSNVWCDLQIFYFFVLSIFRWRKPRGKAWFSSYFLLDKWLRILPKAYLISGMKYTVYIIEL
jgi:hypothetical protein